MSRPFAAISAAVLFAACAASPANRPAPFAPPAPSAAAASSSSAATLPSPAASAPLTQPKPDDHHSPSASAVPRQPEPDAPLPAYLAHPVAFERPYKLGARGRFVDNDLARDEEQEFARWNEGGRQGKWHPQPRVVVDNVRVQGKVSPNAVLREARKNGYWPIRKCYDAALPANQQLDGKLSLRFTLRSNGRATAATLTGRPTLASKQVIGCLRTAFRGLELVRPRKGDARITLDIALHPGDAPMKPAEDPPATPGTGVLDPLVVQALVATAIGPSAQRCYESGLARVPGLWGRLALRADVETDGTIAALIETESTFPDQLTTACVTDALRAARLPPPQGGALRMVIPIRFGTPE